MPSPSSITTTQSLGETIGVSGNPTPTGSVTLSSGTYTSAATPLVSGSATITVPANSLAPGTDTLTLTSPGFPHAVVHLANGNDITINAPGASASKFYVKSLRLDGQEYTKLWVPYSQLEKGATRLLLSVSPKNTSLVVRKS